MYLFFDTETTGLPRNWKAPLTDLDNWPRLVQLAWLVYDKEGNKIAGNDCIVKPQGYTIPPDATKIHGISTEQAMNEGIALETVLNEFQSQVAPASFLIAHNMSFDEKIIGAEFLRNKMADAIAPKKKICTMISSTDYCKLPGPYGYKWPSLGELYKKLFSLGFAEAHNAAVDIDATAKCFWQLKNLGVI